MKRERKTHAGAGDVQGGQSYFAIVGSRLYAVELVIWKGEDWVVFYHVISGDDLDGTAGESPLDEFRKRVKP